MKIRAVLKILLLPIGIIGLPLQPAHGWECEITLNGPNGIKVGQTITLAASGAPEGGSYSWSATPNLVPSGSTAKLTGFKPEKSEYIRVAVKYSSPSGGTCSAVKWIWVCICYVKITGPTEAKVGDPPITLTSEGDPPGGIYEWSDTPGLVPDGPEAQFTPENPGEVSIEVSYTAPGGETCSDTHTINVSEGCSVVISGPSEVKVDESITLTATAAPEGGIYLWEPIDGLEANNAIAQFIGQSPGEVTIRITYTSPGGGTCSDTHAVNVFECSVSISGPSEVAEGDTISLTAEGAPSGGTYQWSDTPGLVPDGPEAQFTPENPGDVAIEVIYTSPEKRMCSNTHTITVLECLVSISGPQEVNVCESITLTAEGNPPGGAYSWTPMPGLESNGETAKFTGQAAGDAAIEVTYTPPDGDSCPDTHIMTLEAECPELSVPLFKQCNPLWNTDTDFYDHINRKICNSGCLLISAVMVLRYYGVITGIDGKEVNPRNLNDWLKDNRGYTEDGLIFLKKVSFYSENKVNFSTTKNPNFDSVHIDLREKRPPILYLIPLFGSHFVVATGEICIENERTWTIRDPGYNKDNLLEGYSNKYYGFKSTRKR